jgi:hypothetical protein
MRGQHRHRHFQGTAAALRQPLQHNRILGRQARRVLQPRHDAETRPAGEAADLGNPVVEQCHVPAELVDEVAGHHAPVFRGQDGMRADQRGDHAAAVDVADEHDRHIGARRKAHIGDVAGPQIDFRRRARAFDDDKVGTGRNDPETFQHRVHQLRLQRLVVAPLRLVRRPCPAR